jgi:hypothetical protein
MFEKHKFDYWIVEWHTDNTDATDFRGSDPC